MVRIVGCHNICFILNKNVSMTSLDRVSVKTKDDDDDDDDDSHNDNDDDDKNSPHVAK